MKITNYLLTGMILQVENQETLVFQSYLLRLGVWYVFGVQSYLQPQGVTGSLGKEFGGFFWGTAGCHFLDPLGWLVVMIKTSNSLQEVEDKK